MLTPQRVLSTTGVALFSVTAAAILVGAVVTIIHFVVKYW